jgi:DDE superfamily endonuclease
MSGALIGQTLELWSGELRTIKAPIRSLFGHAGVAASAAAFLDGLLGPERRKTGWMRAEAAGGPGPWRQQAVLGRSRWDADASRDLVRDYALATLAVPDAVLVIDETGFLKQGTSSCGVQRQYTGSAGRITNCQIGVFAAYVSDRGHAFIDRQLYLPRSWTDQPACRSRARRPALRHQAGDRGRNARAGAQSGRILRLGCRRQHRRRGRGREGPAPSGQGLRARGRRHAPVLVLGRGAGGRHGGRDRPGLAGIGLGTSLGG